MLFGDLSASGELPAPVGGKLEGGDRVALEFKYPGVVAKMSRRQRSAATAHLLNNWSPENSCAGIYRDRRRRHRM